MDDKLPKIRYEVKPHPVNSLDREIVDVFVGEEMLCQISVERRTVRIITQNPLSVRGVKDLRANCLEVAIGSMEAKRNLIEG